jgi:hypothetical protein
LTISGSTQYIQFYNLEIDVSTVDSKGVIVNDDIGLFVQNELHLENGDLRLVGDSQLIQTHSGVDNNTSNTGNLIIDQQGTANAYGYNYWSAPTTNTSGSFTLNGGLFDGTDSDLNPFTPQQVLFNSGSPYLGIPAILDVDGNVSTPLYVSKQWLYTYPASQLKYDGWQAITENTNIAPGYGFTMKGTGTTAQNYSFKGIPNNGEFSLPVSNRDSFLVGNPYPCALDAYQFIFQNSVINDILFWVDGGSDSHILAEYLGGYAIRNLITGVGPSIIPVISGVGSSALIEPQRYIPVGQGFFVDAIADGNVTFNNSQRFYQIEHPFFSTFLRQTEQNDLPYQSNDDKFIRIGFYDPEGFHRQLVLAFLPNAPVDAGYNPGYDSFIPEIREDDLFFIINNDTETYYVIQSVGAYNNTLEFPLGLVITEIGLHRITLDSVENFTDEVYIRDNNNNQTYNISEADFEFNFPAAEYFERFDLVFQPSAALSLNEFVLDDLQVYFKEGQLLIHNKTLIDIREVVVYDLLGKIVKSYSINQENKRRINLTFSYPQSIYMTVVKTADGNKTFKIIN